MAENSAGAACPRPGLGRPFPKGVSGNPGGRPRVLPELRELAREHSEKAIQALVEIIGSQDPKLASARVAACVALLDRGFGRPATSIQIDHAGAVDLDRGAPASMAWLQRVLAEGRAKDGGLELIEHFETLPAAREIAETGNEGAEPCSQDEPAAGG